jgi:uncharacterized protein YerC
VATISYLFGHLATDTRVAALLNDGLSIRDIADETGISKSSVQRIKQAIAEELTPLSHCPSP